MNNNQRIPPLDPLVVEWLERCFSRKTPHPKNNSTEDLWYSAGQQSVLDKLRLELKRQQENTLEKT